MSQYTVGGVAALFGKPKEASTAAGRKLQSLFEDFHCKKNKSGFQSKKSETSNQNFQIRENGDSEVHSNSKKSKKRKFSAISESDSTLSVENNVNRFGDERERKISKQKLKGNDSAEFPRKKKKKLETPKSNASELQMADNASKPNSGFIKKSKHNKMKNNSDSFDEVNSGIIKKPKHKKNRNSFDEANPKNAKVRNNDEVSDDEDLSLKEELRKFIEDNSERKKLGKKEKFDTSQIPPKESTKMHKSKKNLAFEDATLSESFATTQASKFDSGLKTSPNKQNQTADFVRKPKNKNKGKNNLSRHYDEGHKSENDASFRDASSSENFANRQISKIDSDFNASSNKQNQTADFVRKPKNKNKDKNNTSRYYDKSVEDTFNGDDDDALFKSKHEESDVSHKKSGIKLNGVQSSKKVPAQNTSGETDFIPISDPIPESDLKPDDADRFGRTVFVGNLPVNVNKKALKKLFSPFGEIEHIRSVKMETDKSKIYSKNPPKSLNPNYASDSVPAFVVFTERQSAIDALSLTGTVFKGRHITVDMTVPRGSKKLYDGNRSVFIGNLPFHVKDESIWDAFSECGRIDGVRLVRDRETGIGKGFGYVLFSTVQSKENALGLKDLEIEGRSIRIKAVESDKQKQKSKETPTKRDTFKSRAIRSKKINKNPNSRKSVSKLMKKEKNKHGKRKVAAILMKSMK